MRNDGSNQTIYSKDNPFFSVPSHVASTPDTRDTESDSFLSLTRSST